MALLNNAQRAKLQLLIEAKEGKLSSIDSTFGVTGDGSGIMNYAERQQLALYLRTLQNDTAAIDLLFNTSGIANEQANMVLLRAALAGDGPSLDALGFANTFNGNFGALFTGVRQYLRSDLGITQAGGIVSAWADQSGNGVNVAQGSGAGIGNVTTGLNGHAGVAADGSTQWGTFTLAFPAPGTTPTFYWAVWRLLSAPSAPSSLLNDGGFTFDVFVNQSTTNLFSGDGSNAGPVTATVGSWGRMEVAYGNSASDYIKFGPNTATAIMGNTTSAGSRGLFAQPAGSGKIGAELLALVTTNNIPSAPTLATAAAAAQSFYTVSVSI